MRDRTLEPESPPPVADEPLIIVTEGGPYRVEGGVPLVRAGIVYTEYGEPVEWEVGPEFEHSEAYELCRCGHSSRKPYCDRTHERIGFDGTETADRGPSEARRAVFEGDGLRVTDDVTLCSSAGFCTNRLTNVWRMVEEASDPEVRRRIAEMVSRCPSGRLQYSLANDLQPVEPELTPSVGVEPDGPYRVMGRVRIVSDDGTQWEVRNRVTLCRCGASSNKPFCDGTHKRIGFRDAARPQSEALAD
jgi:CDGSH-type Zn-finger protein